MATMKKVQLLMLPTNEKAQSFITLLHGKLYLNDKLHGYDTIQKPQHLYFLSDEEIKEVDWFLHTSHGISEILKASTCNDKEIFGENEEGKWVCWKDYSKKIIATTDSSLTKSLNIKNIGGSYETVNVILPQPSQSFLEVFITEYNKGNQIKEVLVEYEKDEEFMGKLNWLNKLKVNPKDNTITIKKVKHSWSREEVVVLTLKMQHDFEQYKRDCHYSPNTREIAEWTDKWIEQNL